MNAIIGIVKKLEPSLEVRLAPWQVVMTTQTNSLRSLVAQAKCSVLRVASLIRQTHKAASESLCDYSSSLVHNIHKADSHMPSAFARLDHEPARVSMIRCL